MFHVAPIGFALGCAALAVFCSLWCSGYVYEEPSATTAAPYSDAGFDVLPNLSSSVRWLPQSYALVHGCAFVIFTMFHQHRITILRRISLIVCASIALQETQMLCTTLPSPNHHAHFLRIGVWSYDLYVMQYTVCNLMVFVFVSQPFWRSVWTAAGGFGCLLLIATHRYYTVDVICAVIPPVLTFLLYHWYARSETAIMKRHVMYWLERDVFVVDSVAEQVEAHSTASSADSGEAVVARQMSSVELRSSSSPSLQASLDDAPEWPLLENLLTWTVDEHRWIPRSWNVFRLEREGIYSIYPSTCLFAVTDGRGPSSATQSAKETIRRRSFRLVRQQPAYHDVNACGSVGDEAAVAARAMETVVHDPAIVAVAELVERAKQLDPKTRKYLPIAVALICIASAASVGLFNLVSIHYADKRRPLHIPYPPDVIHDLVAALPDRTADFFIYPIVVCTVVFALASSFSWIIFTRISCIYALSMSLRMVTMLVTALPDPSPACVERVHPEGTTCGDLVYSGHTVGLLMSAFTFRYFTKERIFEVMTWILTAAGLFCVVASRLHYTKDVVVSLYVITLANHIARVVLSNHVSLVRSSRLAWVLECGYYCVIARDWVDPTKDDSSVERREQMPQPAGVVCDDKNDVPLSKKPPGEHTREPSGDSLVM